MYFNLAFMRAKVQKNLSHPLEIEVKKEAAPACRNLPPETASKTNTCMKTTTFYLVA